MGRPTVGLSAIKQFKKKTGPYSGVHLHVAYKEKTIPLLMHGSAGVPAN